MLARFLGCLAAAVFLALPTLAQSQGTPAMPVSDPTTTSPSSNSTSTAPKKVWTNDDLPGAKGGRPSAADKRNQNGHAASNQTADAATASRIKKDLEKFQEQLDDVNKQLKAYKDFQNGEAVSTAARDMSKGINHVPVDQQIAQLLDKKKQLEGKISDLYDEARQKGIDSGQLR